MFKYNAKNKKTVLDATLIHTFFSLDYEILQGVFWSSTELQMNLW